MYGAATNAPFPLQENPARYKSTRYKIARWKVMCWLQESVDFTFKVYWHQFLQHWTHTRMKMFQRLVQISARARNKVPNSSQKFPEVPRSSQNPRRLNILHCFRISHPFPNITLRVSTLRFSSHSLAYFYAWWNRKGMSYDAPTCITGTQIAMCYMQQPHCLSPHPVKQSHDHQTFRSTGSCYIHQYCTVRKYSGVSKMQCCALANFGNFF